MNDIITDYEKLAGKNENISKIPLIYVPIIDVDIIEQGVFYRYFFKKVNESAIYETDENSYLKQNNKLYEFTKLIWFITGEMEEVYNKNRKATEYQEPSFRGLIKTIDGNYTQFYIKT